MTFGRVQWRFCHGGIGEVRTMGQVIVLEVKTIGTACHIEQTVPVIRTKDSDLT
jgi:hypothetical protein